MTAVLLYASAVAAAHAISTKTRTTFISSPVAQTCDPDSYFADPNQSRLRILQVTVQADPIRSRDRTARLDAALVCGRVRAEKTLEHAKALRHHNRSRGHW